MEKIKLGPKLPRFVLPIVAMGANVGGKPNYCAVAWVTVIGNDPPMLGLVLGKGRKTMEGARENGTFSINLPGTTSAMALDYCGLVSGHERDKSEIFTSFYGTLGSAPMAEECPLSAECSLHKIVDFGNTEMIVGEVKESYVDENCIVDGNPDIKKLDPLIYAMLGGPYYSVGNKIADAYKIGKDFRKK
ncbi:MAG: flavin reductase family protein [Euryarchaeota archaeon]|nr:flavin reductase family protein [Euryarchaeota archaeon]